MHHCRRLVVFVIFSTLTTIATFSLQEPSFGSSSPTLHPIAIAVSHRHVWLADVNGNALTIFPSNAAASEHVETVTYHHLGLDGPDAIAYRGSYLWVANNNANTITQISAKNAALVKVIGRGTNYFDAPQGIYVDGTHIWVLNSANEVTELNASSGDLVRVIRSATLADPAGFAVSGKNIWVSNYQGNSVAEFSQSTGVLLRVIRGRDSGLDGPGAVLAQNSHLWVVNQNGGSVSELSAQSGALIRIIGKGHLTFPEGIAYSDQSLLVTDGDRNSILKIDPRNGAIQGVVRGSQFHFDNPRSIVTLGHHAWILSVNSGAVTEINVLTGALVSVTTVPKH